MAGRMKSETMYIALSILEAEPSGLASGASASRRLHYADRELRGEGQPWYRDVQTGERFHVQHARVDGMDRSEGRKRGGFPVEIDDDVREEYWTHVRREPSRAHEQVMRS